MFAVIGRPRFTQDLSQQDALRILNKVVATCEQSGGFRGLCSVRVSEREVVNIFLWDTREDGERGRANVRPVVVDFFGATLDGVPEFTYGEVIFTAGVLQHAAVE